MRYLNSAVYQKFCQRIVHLNPVRGVGEMRITHNSKREDHGDSMTPPMKSKFRCLGDANADFQPKRVLGEHGRRGPGGVAAELNNARSVMIAPSDECGGHEHAQARHRRPRSGNGERRDAESWRGGVPKKRNAAGTRRKAAARTNRAYSQRVIGPARKAV
jgi:hypothetical protein